MKASKADGFARQLYSSAAWARTRKAFAESKGGLCERCLARGLYTPGEQVHHIIHLTPENISDPAIALGWDNLMLVCKACHDDLHRAPRRWCVDEGGAVEVTPPYHKKY